MLATPTTHSFYRSDIDGLRAIAVIAVVIFHSFPTYLRGGFIGVDIFFVISGFLISNIIFENLHHTKFSLSTFYARRIRRIFPSLILILVFCYVIGWGTLFPDEFKQLGKQIAAGAGFVANIALWREAGYFDNAAETKPLLHLWSLGIEEQFYIIWPILLWAAWKRKYIPILLTLSLLIASFYMNIRMVGRAPVATFYLPFTRIWELLFGALLAWLSFHKLQLDLPFGKSLLGRVQLQNQIAHLLSTIGLSLILIGLFVITKNSRFPGAIALIPVLGSTLLIAAGPNGWANKWILSNRAFVWIGLISYPLYLWHWPLLTYARIIESGTPSESIRIGAVILSIILAWLSFTLVEKPIRFGHHARLSTTLLISAMLIIGLTGSVTYWKNGLPDRSVVLMHGELNSGNDGGDKSLWADGCGLLPEDQKLFRKCVQDQRAKANLALMGDSKAEALSTGLIRTATPHNHWLFIGGASTLGAPTPLLATENDPARQLTVKALKAITENPNIKTVALVAAIRSLFLLDDGVVGGNIATYNYNYLTTLDQKGDDEKVFDQFNRVVSILIKANKDVILVVDNPALPNPQDCLNRKTTFGILNSLLSRQNMACTIQLSSYEKQIIKYRKLLERIQKLHPERVVIFDPTNIYCDPVKNVCESVKNGRLMYSYTDHISDYASGLVGQKLNELIANR